ncbi:hypothetical protein K449DRAFT_387251 [Hypoxylon sp. EC38]|nr:hypothetical protein K449DRAFT_387251 [Hypoxylon sp. EC38]
MAEKWAFNSILWRPGDVPTEQRLKQRWSISELDDLFKEPQKNHQAKKSTGTTGRVYFGDAVRAVERAFVRRYDGPSYSTKSSNPNRITPIRR